MNIAFPALLIVLFALPGVLFRHSLLTGTLTSPHAKEPLATQVLWGVFAASVLHLIWSILWSRFGVPVDHRAILTLLIGAPEAALSEAIATTTATPHLTIAYFISISLAGWALGHLAHKLIRFFHLDWTYKFLRFDNPWWYLLSGEQKELAAGTHVKDDGVLVSTIVHQGEVSFLYFGVLEAFHFAEDGTLDRVELSSVSRRRADNDDPSAHRYELGADYFILKYASVNELTLSYLTWDDGSGALES